MKMNFHNLKQMKRISSDEVKKVAQLARLELNENEINQLLVQD